MGKSGVSLTVLLEPSQDSLIDQVVLHRSKAAHSADEIPCRSDIVREALDIGLGQIVKKEGIEA